MNKNEFLVGEIVAISQDFSYSSTLNYSCGSDDDCGCEGGEGSCECGYDPECNE